jgi:L-asparaginase II
VTLGLVEKTPLHNCCSGKHTGMLAACRQLGYPTESYIDAAHPLQQEILNTVATFLRVDPESILLGVDGCSLPTYGTSLSAFAVAFAAFSAPERIMSGNGSDHAVTLLRLRSAMAANPENIAGKGDVDTDLMIASQGRIVAKLGAEGLLCLAIPEHEVGIAIRILDGSGRAFAAVVAAILEQLELTDPSVMAALKERHNPEVTNVNGWQVGEIPPAFELTLSTHE